MLFIIGLAVWAHVNFFVKDLRPFVDHDAYYLYMRSFILFSYIYDFIVIFIDKISPDLRYNGFFVYKMINIIYLMPLIIFTYLSAASLYSRGAGLLAAFFLITHPDILNVFHKSEVNFILVFCFSMSLCFFIKSKFLWKFYYSLLFFLALLVFAWHHYSFVLYFNICLPVVCLIILHRRKKEKKISKKFVLMMLFVVLCMEISLGFVFLWSSSGLLCSLFPALAVFILYKFYKTKIISRRLLVVLVLFFLSVELYLIHLYLPYLIYVFNVVKSQLFVVADMQSARYTLWEDFFSLYLKRICFFYRPTFFVVDFTFINYFICILFYVFYLFGQFRRKRNFSSLEIFEFAFLWIVFSGLFMLAFDLGAHAKFFAPFWILLVILNAGFFYRIYYLCIDFFLAKFFLLVVLVFLILMGMFSLFRPDLLVRNVQNHKNFYCYIKDDYNLSELVNFFEKENTDISLEKIIFLTGEGDEPRNMVFCSFWLGQNIKLKQIVPLVKKRYPAYVVALYNYDKVDNKPVNVAAVDDQLKAEIAESIHLNDKGKLFLKKIILYGKEQKAWAEIRKWDTIKNRYTTHYTGQKEKLMLTREFLIFIYKTDF